MKLFLFSCCFLMLIVSYVNERTVTNSTSYVDAMKVMCKGDICK